MKRLFLLFVMAAVLPAMAVRADDSDFDAAFQKIAAKLSESGPKLPDKTVAVYGFETIGRPGDDFATYATEKLTHEIVTIGTFMVIERSRIDEVLKEQSLSLSGTIDVSTASKIGKILAVDAVIIGSIHVTDTGIEFIARIIQSEKGVILASADERLKLTAPGTSKESGVAKDTAKDSNTAKDAGSTKDNKTVDSGADAKVSTDKTTYGSSDPVKVTFSGFPGNDHDWITIVAASEPDTSYNEWFYTAGMKAGELVFKKLSPGDYEVRAYFDYPGGGYVVHSRAKIKVVK